jgi:hypothetical protein
VFYRTVACAFLVLALGACSKSMSPEEQAQVASLKQDLSNTDTAIAAAIATDARYSGGAVKALATFRLEILKTNKALLQQRIAGIEAGAPITVKVNVSKADPERAKTLAAELATQEKKASAAEDKASAGGGGLIGVMALVEAATARNTVALLQQEYLVAKYGLAPIPVPTRGDSRFASDVDSSRSAASPTEATDDGKLQYEIVVPTILSKKYEKENYQDAIWFNIKFDASGLDKPTRAIKGALILTNLFGDTEFGLNMTIDEPMKPGETYTKNGTGFDYNQFTDSHQWVLATALKDMKAKFRVDSILYADGTRRDF